MEQMKTTAGGDEFQFFKDREMRVAKSIVQRKYRIYGLALVSMLLVGSSALSFVNPMFYFRIIDNPVPYILGVAGLATYAYAFYLVLVRTETNKRLNREDVFVRPLAREPVKVTASVAEKKFFEENAQSDGNGRLPTIMHLDTPFEAYVNRVVHALDERINISEKKAQELLSSGKAYLFGGVVCYMGAVVIWQLVEHYLGYSHFLLLGMISTSIMFIVVEFLAAWFLKQYRSYVDSSIVYLSVRSAFNRYLLTYYAVNQFSKESDSLKVMVDLLANEIKWPAHKDVTNNDFNYMVESMGSIATVLEKIKGTIKAPAANGPETGKPDKPA
ncbi:hypothetical protein [Pseudomonas putida]|uniref:hypothetical protein n=1 Tax=Pseudomonas putida TaxID=303 RepID=UPI0037CB9ABC